MRGAIFALALALAACGSSSSDETPDAGTGGEADANVPGVKLLDWVNDIVDHRAGDLAEPDTVLDKTVIDTENEHEFDSLLPSQ